jgi:hypothetical protein
MQLESVLTYPSCQHQATETMPTDACQFFYDCKGCGKRLKPLAGDNHGTKTNAVEPALSEMREMMFGGKFTIAGHNHELLDEMRNYHRDEDFKIVKQRDDLVSAVRYGIMMRRQGKPLTECEGVGYGNMPYAMRRPERAHGSQYAIGTANHPGGDFDVFTGT